MRGHLQFVCFATVLVAWMGLQRVRGAVERSPGAELVAEHFERRTIYHSPQTPGWTSWVGAWLMPDGSIMACCTQATGPVDDRLKTRSFAGLHVSVIYLRSFDKGKSWSKVADSDVSFGTGENSGLGTHANNGGAAIALKDGSILRRVYGFDYGHFGVLPGTAYMQISRDGAKTWSDPPRSSDGGKTWINTAPIQQLLLDPSKYTVQITRQRRLSDGRLVICGGVWNAPHTQSAAYQPLLMVSSDEARTWRRVDFAGPHYDPAWNQKFDEWDFAELSDGDLLIVSRPSDNTRRWAGLLRKAGKGWLLDSFHQTTLPHSGHPELLRTRQGPILHIAQTGIDWTTDAGAHWAPVIFPGLQKSFRPREEPSSLATLYYPRSLQTPDGTIYVFAHRGWDNAYGQRDQSVVMDTFRLAWKNKSADLSHRGGS